jgi:hypothetical protein
MTRSRSYCVCMVIALVAALTFTTVSYAAGAPRTRPDTNPDKSKVERHTRVGEIQMDAASGIRSSDAIIAHPHMHPHCDVICLGGKVVHGSAGVLGWIAEKVGQGDISGHSALASALWGGVKSGAKTAARVVWKNRGTVAGLLAGVPCSLTAEFGPEAVNGCFAATIGAFGVSTQQSLHARCAVAQILTSGLLSGISGLTTAGAAAARLEGEGAKIMKNFGLSLTAGSAISGNLLNDAIANQEQICSKN